MARRCKCGREKVYYNGGMSGTNGYWACSDPFCQYNRRPGPAGLISRRRDGNWDEYHGRGVPTNDGGVKFDDSQGKHSHAVKSPDLKTTIWERKEGEKPQD